MTDASHHHRSLPSSEAVKLEAVARLLRQALRLAEGAEAAASEVRHEGPATAAAPPPPPVAPEAPPAARSTPPPADGPGRPGGPPQGPAQVGYLLQLLQTEQARLDEVKKEVARRDTELGLKLQFAKKKEEELESREGELKKLEAQLRVREQQVARREERQRDMGRMGPSE